MVIEYIIGIAAIIILVGILVLWKIIKDRKSGLPIVDERTRRVKGQAAYYALILGIYFALALLWVTFLGPKFLGLPELGTMPALISTILVSSISFLALRWYLNSKEDF